MKLICFHFLELIQLKLTHRPSILSQQCKRGLRKVANATQKAHPWSQIIPEKTTPRLQIWCLTNSEVWKRNSTRLRAGPPRRLTAANDQKHLIIIFFIASCLGPGRGGWPSPSPLLTRALFGAKADWLCFHLPPLFLFCHWIANECLKRAHPTQWRRRTSRERCENGSSRSLGALKRRDTFLTKKRGRL